MVVIMECEKSSSDEDGNCVRKRSIAEIYSSCEPVAVPNGGKKHGRRRNIYERIVCKKCGEGYGKGRLLLLCDGCDNGYHMYCLCPILVRIPKGKWFCPACSRKDGIRETKRRRRHNLCMYKRKKKLIPHVPSKDPEQRLRQMASLATALTSTRVNFCDELTYIPGLAPRSANRVEFEGASMQVIGKEDKATLELCKLMCARGEWPPLMVSYDPKQGFVVEADAHIKDMTLIAEYTGDVDYMMNREHDESDSLMGLLFSKDPSKELVICPDKRGNIARFVSGINNHTREGRKKQNLRCVRFNIDGEARALLVAFRDIPKEINQSRQTLKEIYRQTSNSITSQSHRTKASVCRQPRPSRERRKTLSRRTSTPSWRRYWNSISANTVERKGEEHQW